jgi:NAD(P)-dependent dehydrogenase (short-subunit alcohol dehydrogenase family)
MTQNRKRIILTGAASGIGAATLAHLRLLGHAVVGLDINTDRGNDLIACDVRDENSVNDAVSAAIARLGGGVDVLINGAGIGTPQSAGEMPDARAQAVLDVNALGPWRVTSAALPALRTSRGRVVNVASGLAFVAFPFATAYAMSKHAVVAYSQALRLEHGDAIAVTTVYPGYIKTPIHQESIDFGMTLQGAAHEERIEDAVAALVRAAVGKTAPRDIITTRSGKVTTAMTRHLPGRVVDHIIRRQMRKSVRRRRGKLGEATGPLGEFARRNA